MDDRTYFERLLASATSIARHARFPGKEEAISLCLEDIEDLVLAGRITLGQRDRLHEALLGSLSGAA